jgi:uncharacterized membrane protein SirB2
VQVALLYRLYRDAADGGGKMIAKYIHVSCVILTFVLFSVRGIWMMTGSGMLRRKWVRVLPPVIDTILLLSAIVLAISIQQYPFVHAWLTTKVVILFFYIGFGMLALTYGKTREVRMASWIAAQLCFIYIVAVALTRNPWPLA